MLTFIQSGITGLAKYRSVIHSKKEGPMAISDLTLAGLTRTQLLEMHYKMALLRRFEEKSAEEYTRG